jgi:NADH:ubiquinone oxidoreductase subunit 3 (subunit A)
MISVLAASACGGGGDDAPGVDAAVVYPPMADLARDIVDTTLWVDLAARTATATITLAPSLSTGATFEIGSLVINAVRLGDRPLQFVETGPVGERLDIGVPPTTEPLVITIDYGWRYHDSSNGVAMAGYTLTWPYHCGNVFPCRSEPSDGTTFHLTVSGAATGMALYPAEIPDEAPAYMAAWIVGDFTRLDLGTTTAGTRVAMWHRANEAAAATAGGAHLRASFALLIGIAGLAVSTLLGPRRTWTQAKYEPYECGVDQIQNPHRPFAIKFYVFALLFILFDIETIFLLPFAAGFQGLLGTGALWTVLVFSGVLALGLAYILRSGALDWD